MDQDPKDASQTNPDTSGPREGDEIFVVDDDERFAGRLARAFEDRGFAVRKSHSYAEAVAELERQPAQSEVGVLFERGEGVGLLLCAPLQGALVDELLLQRYHRILD